MGVHICRCMLMQVPCPSHLGYRNVRFRGGGGWAQQGRKRHSDGGKQGTITKHGSKVRFLGGWTGTLVGGGQGGDGKYASSCIQVCEQRPYNNIWRRHPWGKKTHDGEGGVGTVDEGGEAGGEDGLGGLEDLDGGEGAGAGGVDGGELVAEGADRQGEERWGGQ